MQLEERLDALVGILPDSSVLIPINDVDNKLKAINPLIAPNAASLEGLLHRLSQDSVIHWDKAQGNVFLINESYKSKGYSIRIKEESEYKQVSFKSLKWAKANTIFVILTLIVAIIGVIVTIYTAK